MDGEKRIDGNRAVGFGHVKHQSVGLRAVDDFEMLFDGFTADRDSVFEDDRRLAERERVTLDCVGGIDVQRVFLDPHRPKALDLFSPQRPHRIQARLGLRKMLHRDFLR